MNGSVLYIRIVLVDCLQFAEEGFDKIIGHWSSTLYCT